MAQGSPDPHGALAATLVDNHRAFLRFLERRVGDRETAEDILQEAFAKGLDRLHTVRHGESVVAWFYRTLRNAVIDHYRRSAVASRALSEFAGGLDEAQAPDEGLHEEVCQCVNRLMATLKPEYAEVLRQVEVDGVSVKDFGAARGLTASNAGVRVFRAREALRRRVVESCGACAEHGCLNCTCGQPGAR